jgi:hypothetical protein
MTSRRRISGRASRQGPESPTHGLTAPSRAISRPPVIRSDRLNSRTTSPGGGGSVPCCCTAQQARAPTRRPGRCPLDLTINRSRLQDAERENRPWFSTSRRYQAQPLSMISSIRLLSMSIASCPIGARGSRRVADARCGKNRARAHPSLKSFIDLGLAPLPLCRDVDTKPIRSGAKAPRLGPAVSFAQQSIGDPPRTRATIGALPTPGTPKASQLAKCRHRPQGPWRVTKRYLCLASRRYGPSQLSRAPMDPPATKLLVFTLKGSTVWAGDFHGTRDAVTITLLSPGEGSPRDVLYKSGRLRAGLRLGHTIDLCPRVLDAIPRPALRLAEPSLPGIWWG